MKLKLQKGVCCEECGCYCCSDLVSILAVLYKRVFIRLRVNWNHTSFDLVIRCFLCLRKSSLDHFQMVRDAAVRLQKASAGPPKGPT